MNAGRPFFMVMGVTQASTAPAARSASIQLRRELAGRVVDVRLEHDVGRAVLARRVRGRRTGAVAEHGAQHVRPVAQLGAAGAPADALGDHRRPPREPVACAPTMAAPVGVTSSKSMPAS